MTLLLLATVALVSGVGGYSIVALDDYIVARRSARR